uniref:Uncharacterized protein n=1 Tax=Arundo donax TaxID=35708 RepID=A0A0A9F554_ARUDO
MVVTRDASVTIIVQVIQWWRSIFVYGCSSLVSDPYDSSLLLVFSLLFLGAISIPA